MSLSAEPASVLGVTARDRVARRLAEIGQEFGHGHALELGRIERALEALGRPQDRLPPVVHVAGTNGKGSVCACLRAIAEASGLKAHVFSSPHLIRPNERVRVAGKLASDEQFLDALDRLAATHVEITYFEAITACAFLLFSETPADLLALEVGLGGTFDATNVVDPAVSVIAPVDLDHAHILGPGLGRIAAEKAGVLKPGRPAVIARQRPEAEAVIEARAAAVGAPLERCGVEWDCWRAQGRMALQMRDRFIDLPIPALIGPHQIENAGLAARAALLLGAAQITDDSLGRGIGAAKWPARMQPIVSGPLAAPVLAAGGELWVDGAHNTHAGLALKATLAELRGRAPRPTIAVVGMLGSKDASGFLSALGAETAALVTTPIHTSRASRDPVDLAAGANALGLRAQPARSLPEAITLALAAAPAPRILICGSLYLAGEALELSGVRLD